MEGEIKKLRQLDNGDIVIQVSPRLWDEITSELPSLHISEDDPKARARDFILLFERLELSIRTYNCLKRSIVWDPWVLYIDDKLMSLDDFVRGVLDDSLQPHLLQVRNFGPKLYQELKDDIRRYLA